MKDKTMTPIPDEAVELAAKLAAAANSSVAEGYDLDLFWSCLDERAQSHWLKVVRAALPAIRDAVVGEYRELVEAAKAATEQVLHDGMSSRAACDRLIAALAALTEQENRNGNG